MPNAGPLLHHVDGGYFHWCPALAASAPTE